MQRGISINAQYSRFMGLGYVELELVGLGWVGRVGSRRDKNDRTYYSYSVRVACCPGLVIFLCLFRRSSSFFRFRFFNLSPRRVSPLRLLLLFPPFTNCPLTPKFATAVLPTSRSWDKSALVSASSIWSEVSSATVYVWVYHDRGRTIDVVHNI